MTTVSKFCASFDIISHHELSEHVNTYLVPGDIWDDCKNFVFDQHYGGCSHDTIAWNCKGTCAHTSKSMCTIYRFPTADGNGENSHRI